MKKKCWQQCDITLLLLSNKKFLSEKFPKMSTESPASIFRLCHFESPFLPPQTYYCYRDETCCKEGCCHEPKYKYLQSWRIWLGIIILFVLYRCISKCCHKNEGRIEPEIIEQTVSFENLRVDPKDDDYIDPPPIYNVAINLPKPENLNEIPTYEQATAMTNK